MNNKIFSNLKYAKLLLLIVFFISVLPLKSFAQSNELSLVDIFTALRSQKATLEQKNQILTAGVNQRGITFILSESMQEELQNAGANEKLIEAIRQRSLEKTATIEPSVQPTPEPVEQKPEKDFAFFQNRGNSSFVVGDYNNAVIHYSEAIKQNENEAAVYLTRGLAFYRLKQFNAAISDFTRFIETNPKDSMVYFNRGNALQEVGKFEEALEDYRKATEIDADNKEAQQAFEKLQAVLAPAPVAQNDQNTRAPEEFVAPAVTDEKKEDTANSAVPLNIGTLQSLIVKLKSPVYPTLERSVGIEGIVTVRIVLDKKGRVISAKAIDGPRGLYRSSEAAAKRSKFKAYEVKDKPVSVTGVIKYNFKVR